MKIAFVYGSLMKGGAERVIVNLANKISDNYDVSIIIFTDSESAYPLNNNVELIYPDKNQNGKSPLQRMAGFCHRNKFLKKNIRKFDCIISFNTYLAMQCKILSAGTKVIGSERTNPFLAKNIKERIAIKLSGILDGFVFQTAGAARYYPFAIRKKACIIPNAFWGDIKDMPKYKTREKVICASGRLISSKRYDLIIKAFRIIADKYPDYILKLYGVGDKEADIKRLIESQNLLSRVYLMGWCKNILNELSKNRIFILASDYEGMPNGLIEAMACGCVCISRNCKFGPEEIIDSEENGILVKSDTEVDIAKALIRVIDDEVFAAELSNNACVKIKNEFSEEVMVNKFCNYIDAVIKR